MKISKYLGRKVLNYSKKGAAKLRDFSKYLFLSTALAVAPIAACSDPNRQEQPRHPIEDTGLWAEPYSGQVLQDENGSYYMAERLIMSFHDPVSHEEVLDLTKNFNGRITGEIPQLNSFEVEVIDVDSAIHAIAGHSKVRTVTRNYYFESSWDNEEYTTGEVGLDNGLWWSEKIDLIGGLNLLKNSDISLQPSTIAVIDVGFNLENSDIPYADSSYHFDFGDWDVSLAPPSIIQGFSAGKYAHGTAVAAFAAASNNGELTNGVAAIGSTKILPLKFFSDNLYTDPSSYLLPLMGDNFRVISALVYVSTVAEELNLTTVNLSLGTDPVSDISSFSQPVISLLTSKGIAVVAAVGNDNADACKVIPAALEGVISVGGTRLEQNALGEGIEKRYLTENQASNHSTDEDCLELTAPAQDLLSFSYNGTPWLVGGTSYAAPQVAGLAVLLRSVNPDLTNAEVLQLLRNNADDIVLNDDPDLPQGTIWKRISARRTIEAVLGVQTTWSKTYEANFYSTVQSNGFIAAGSKNGRFHISKLDNSGNILWEHTLESSTHGRDSAKNIISLGGELIAVGNVEQSTSPSCCPSYDAQMMSLDDSGEVLFSKTLPSATASAIQRVSDGFIIAGSSDGGILLLKTDLNGEELWRSEIYAGLNTFGQGVAVSDHEFLVSGVSQTDSRHNMLIRTDLDGDPLWDGDFGQTTSDIFAITALQDGNFVLAGANSYGNGLLIKINSAGSPIWTKTFDDCSFRSVVEAASGTILAVGTKNEDILVVRTDADGTTIWEKTFDGGSSDYGYSITATTDNGSIISGSSDDSGRLIRLNEEGEI
ncbi:S8 family serine peptidase [Candidatus Micrarchaeota archaeon]|nr:S8 family serine peptidase [Candidatus Micrarchaeota archaeon]MBU1681666.1 S8 family serine peptidase [Candidatus Micrarchaeota archaeon]